MLIIQVTMLTEQIPENIKWMDSKIFSTHLCMVRNAVVDTQPCERASNTTEASNLSSPVPPKSGEV